VRLLLVEDRGPGLDIAPAARLRLRAALELGRRVQAEAEERRPRIRGPEDVVQLMAPRLRALQHEEFHVLILNTRHRVLRIQIVSRGILDAALVHPREVFAPALEERGSAVILVHNHPSGDPEPSPEDRRVTDQLARAGEILGIRVLDHIVIGNPGWASVSVG
jgi:DNA repair protein RadC